MGPYPVGLDPCFRRYDLSTVEGLVHQNTQETEQEVKEEGSCP